MDYCFDFFDFFVLFFCFLYTIPIFFIIKSTKISESDRNIAAEEYKKTLNFLVGDKADGYLLEFFK